jgi:hypothetical protein
MCNKIYRLFALFNKFIAPKEEDYAQILLLSHIRLTLYQFWLITKERLGHFLAKLRAATSGTMHFALRPANLAFGDSVFRK